MDILRPIAVATRLLSLASPVLSQDVAKAPPAKARNIAKALDEAMTPGAAQKRLDSLRPRRWRFFGADRGLKHCN